MRHAGERRQVPFEKLTLGINELRQLFELRAAMSGVDVWHSVVVTNVIVRERPSVRHSCGCCEVLRPLRQCRVVREDGAAAASSHRLIPIETKNTHHSK